MMEEMPEYASDAGTEDSIAARHTGWMLFAAGVIIMLLASLLYYTHEQSREAPFSWPQSYSVDVQIPSQDASGAQAWAVNRYSVDGDKVRNELQDSSASPTIIRLDRGEMYTLFPNLHVYHVSTVPAGMTRSDPFPNNATWSEIATETVNGAEAVKYQLSSGSSVMTVWLDAQTHVPLQLANSKGDITRQFSNYNPAAPDQQLFEPPADYTKELS